MSINACIRDGRGVLAGCITDSAVEAFKEAFLELKGKYFGDAVAPVVGVMEKSLVQTVDKRTADFLNCLKLLSRKYRDDAPIGFVQDVSRRYHELVRYCCSQVVYDEVLDETISQFRSAGLEYVGANARGFDQSSCLFEYRGWKVSVRMREKGDLYRMWDANAEGGTVAVVSHDGDEYTDEIPGDAVDVAEEIVAFIDERERERNLDEGVPEEELDSVLDDDGLDMDELDELDEQLDELDGRNGIGDLDEDIGDALDEASGDDDGVLQGILDVIRELVEG